MYDCSMKASCKIGLRISAVIVCVDYDDFLRHTLEENIPHFDDLIVVTNKKDIQTKNLCREMSVRCISTNEFYVNGDIFNKARGINLGIAHLKDSNWIVHLDADIALPKHFRQVLLNRTLDERCIYGIDRLQIIGLKNWLNIKSKKQHIDRSFIIPQEQIVARYMHNMFGWAPIGYFQMWHKSEHKTYPINQDRAEHTDLLHSIQWDREFRILMPEMFCYHLESEKGQMGANWGGRKTKRFE